MVTLPWVQQARDARAMLRHRTGRGAMPDAVRGADSSADCYKINRMCCIVSVWIRCGLCAGRVALAGSVSGVLYVQFIIDAVCVLLLGPGRLSPACRCRCTVSLTHSDQRAELNTEQSSEQCVWRTSVRSVLCPVSKE